MKPPKNIAKPLGRPKGSKDRIQTKVKEAIEQAFDELGGVKYLVTMGKAEPKAFMALLGKVLPKEIKGTVQVNFMADIMQQLYGDNARVIEHDKDEETPLQ